MDSEKVSRLAKTGNDEAATTTTPPYNVALTAKTTAPTTSSSRNAESSMTGQGTTSSRIQISTNRIMVAPNGTIHNSNINSRSRSRSNTNKENHHELNSTIGATSSASACKDIHVSLITAAAGGGGGGGGTTNQESNLETTSKTVQNRVSTFSSQQSQQPVEAAKSSEFVIRKSLHQKKVDPSPSSPSKQGTDTVTTTNGNTASSFDAGTTNRMIVNVIAPKGPMKLKLRRLNKNVPSNTNNNMIVVRDIDPQSPLLNKVFPGDILLSVDGQKYDTLKELVDYIKATGPSQHVLEISRQQQQKHLPTKQDINATTKVSSSSLPVTTITTTAAVAAVPSLLTTNSSKVTTNNHSHDSQNNVVAFTADEKSNISKKRISSPQQDSSNHPKKLLLQLSSPSGSNNDPIHKRNVEIESSLRNDNKNDKEKQRTLVPATAGGKNPTTKTASSSSSSSSSTDVADEPKKKLLQRRQLSSPNFSATITNTAGMYPEEKDQTASSNGCTYEGSSSSSNVAVSDKMDKEQRTVLSTDIPPSKSTISTNTAAMDLHLPSVKIITPGRDLSLSTNLSDSINVASRNNGEIAPTDPQHFAMEPTKKNNQSTFPSGKSLSSAATCSSSSSSSSCGDEKSKRVGIGILKTSKNNDGGMVDEAKIRTMTTRGINENGGEQAAREEEKEKGYNSDDDVVVAAWPGPPPSAAGITMPPRRKRPAGKTLVWYRRHKPEVFDNIPSIVNIQPDSEEDSVGTTSGRSNEKGTAAAQSHTGSSRMVRIEDTFAESSDEEEDEITELPSRKNYCFSLSNIVTSPSLADTVKMRRRERKRKMNEISSDNNSSHNTGTKSINESRRKRKRGHPRKVESQNNNNISVKEKSIKGTKRKRGRPMKDESQNSNPIIEETTLVDTPPNTKRGRSPKESSSNTKHPSYDIDYQATMKESDDAAVLVNRFEAQDFKDKRLTVGSKVYAAFPGIEPSDEPYYWGIISAKKQIEGTWMYRIDFDDGDIIDEVTSAGVMRMDEAYKLYKCTDGVDVLKPPKTYIVDYYSQGPMTMTELQENACGICSQCQTRARCGNCLICDDADVDSNSIMNQCCFHKMCRHIIIPRKAQSLPGYLPESWIFYFDETAANPTKQGLVLLTKEEAKRLPSRGKHVVKSYKSFEDAASLYPDVFSPFDASSFYRAIGIPDGTISTRIRNQMAEALSHGDWVLFSSNDETEPLWLGRVLSNKEFEGKCTWTNNTGDDIIMSDTLIGSHEVALNVIWYERTGVGPRLEYHLSREHPYSRPQNNKNLVDAKFDMQKMQGRDTNPMSLPDLSHLQNSLKDWYKQEYPLVWRMDQAVYDNAIGELHFLQNK